MEIEGDLQFLLIVAVVLLVLLAAILVFNRSEARRVASPKPGGPPTTLPGFWPSGVREQYEALNEDAKRNWWRRYNSTISVAFLLFIFGAFAALATQSVVVAAIVASFILVAMVYAVSGGKGR